MTDNSPLEITQLHKQHNRPAFTCGNTALDTYLHKRANQDVKRHIAKVFVATSPTDTNTIVGYYTLSSLSIELSSLPEPLAKKLPRHPIPAAPAALIGRLAVSQSAQGQGISRLLLADAIKRALAVNQHIAIYAMVVDAINDDAKRFYQKYGFATLQSSGTRLFLPLKTLT